MNILLDTNALVWFAKGSKELGKNAKQLFLSSKVVYFSSISIFELEIKQASKKLKIADNLVDQLEAKGLTELSLKSKEAKEIARFGTLIKHDPFDRMILAQASANELSLITSDRQILSLDFDWVLDARK